MKKAAWFIGLKIVETAGAVLVYILLQKGSCAFRVWAGDPPENWFEIYISCPSLTVIIMVIIVIVLVVLFCGIKAWIRLNAKWADKLAKR